MSRFFGKKKDVPPPPTLADASKSIEGRSGTLDAKVFELNFYSAKKSCMHDLAFAALVS